MDAPDPYRKRHELASLIPPDRRFVLSALIGAVVGALVATSVTLAIVIPREKPMPSTSVPLAVPARPVCTLDRSLGVVVQRDPLPDVARYPGSLVRTSVGDVPHNTAHVVLETCDSPADVLAFYRANHGLTLDGETSERGQRRLTFTKDDGSYTLVFEVNVTPREEGTRIELSSSLPRTRLPARHDVF